MCNFAAKLEKMQIVHLSDLTSPLAAPYSRLTEAQLRNRLDPEQGLFIAESYKVIRIALAQGYKPLSFLTEEKHIEGQVAPLAADFPEVPVLTAPRQMLAQLTGYELSRGILCAMHRPTLPSLDEVCRGRKRIAIIDSVVNATNTGAIFRAAAALGIEAVLLTTTSCDPLNRRSVRVSMGTVFQLPWTYFTSYSELTSLGLTLVALALADHSTSLSDPRLRHIERMGIVLGSEGEGLSDEALSACQHIVRIPMQRGVDSLNVAAAASVAFWQLAAQEPLDRE